MRVYRERVMSPDADPGSLHARCFPADDPAFARSVARALAIAQPGERGRGTARGDTARGDTAQAEPDHVADRVQALLQDRYPRVTVRAMHPMAKMNRGDPDVLYAFRDGTAV
jgi:hypothetical protein